jgi:catechol 2,3-dioxygenase-like lactoylglutathione lyase family enzyme
MTAKARKAGIDVGIVSARGERLFAFYREAIGFEPAGEIRIPGTGTIRRLAWGESVLRILEPETPPPGDAGEGGLTGRPGFRYLLLEIRNLDETVAACVARGARVVVPAFELRPGRRVAQIADPDGNLVEFGEEA